jgi:hypothetical protein
VLGLIWDLAPTAFFFLIVWGLIALAVVLASQLWIAVARPQSRRRARPS